MAYRVFIDKAADPSWCGTRRSTNSPGPFAGSVPLVYFV